MKYLILCSLLLLIRLNLQAQVLENIMSTFDGERVTITYDLTSKNADRFTVTVFGSHDNYNRELIVSGEAGKNVASGIGKKIVWDAKRDLPSEFNADVQIKITVTPEAAISNYAFERVSNSNYRSGRSQLLQWKGGNPDDKIELQLFQGNTRKQVIVSTLGNNCSYDWKIPKDLKGKNYSFKLLTSGSAEPKAESETFKIKSKSSPALIIVPVVLVGGAVAYMLSGVETDD